MLITFVRESDKGLISFMDEKDNPVGAYWGCSSVFSLPESHLGVCS